MYGLKCSEQEAQEIMASDKAINRGEKMSFDLPPDKLKIAQKFTHAGTRKQPTAYKFPKKEKKMNATKAEIIAGVATFMSEKSGFSVQNLDIKNAERQIAFAIGDDNFELTLVQKRKPRG